MKTIHKQFKTEKQAEKFQNKLYNLHNSVILIKFPTFRENGLYIWEVGD